MLIVEIAPRLELHTVAGDDDLLLDGGQLSACADDLLLHRAQLHGSALALGCFLFAERFDA